MGLTAGLLSLPVGVLVAAVLVYVINRRSCGWTLELVTGPQVILPALLDGLYPALRMGRASPTMALRDE